MISRAFHSYPSDSELLLIERLKIDSQLKKIPTLNIEFKCSKLTVSTLKYDFEQLCRYAYTHKHKHIKISKVHTNQVVKILILKK